MAKRRKNLTTKSTVTQENVQQIWEALPINTWVSLAETNFGSGKWTLKGNSVVGCCIKHTENTPSLHINPKKHFAHCFGCGLHVSDPIHLASMLLKRSYEDAAIHLISTYGPFKGISVSVVDKLNQLKHNKEVKAGIEWVLKTELLDAVNVYTNPDTDIKDSDYAYAEPALKELRRRKIPLNLLHLLPLGIVCTSEAFFRKLKVYSKNKNVDIVKDAQKYLENVIPIGPGTQPNHLGWICFTYYADQNTISSFKFRELSETSQKNIVWVKDEGSPTGVFGLGIPLFTEILGKDVNTLNEEVHAVEGEFDALAIICPQIESGDPKYGAIAFSGNSMPSLDSLEYAGYSTVRYIPDWDKRGPDVLRIKLRGTKKLRFKIFNPPMSFVSAGKDAHDAYASLGPVKFLHAILDDKNFVFPPRWALSQAATDLGSVNTADSRKQVEIVGQYMSALNNDVEREEFIGLAASTFNIPEDLLRRQASPNTDDGFIEMLATMLEEEYTFMYQDTVKSGRRITAWNRRVKIPVVFELARPTQIQSMLKADLGSIVDWVEDRVGMPMRFQGKVDKDGNISPPPGREVRQKYYFSILDNDVIPRLIQRRSLNMKSDMVIAGQGIHIPNEDKMYLVNGNKVYIRKKYPGTTVWEELDTPKDDIYLFETDSGRAWSTVAVDEDILNNNDIIDLDVFLDKLINVLTVGFRFENHDLEAQYLAAFILSAPLSDMFEHIPWIFIHGPTNTGKSSLTQVLASQDIYSRAVCLMEHSMSMDNFTAAGVKQLMRGSTLTLVLDEFEVGLDASHGEQKHYNSKNVLELLRGSISHGARVTMGSQSGNPVSYSLRFPFVASGIHAFHKREDINRVNIIEMAVNDAALGSIKVTTPAQLLLTEFDSETIEKYRHTATLCSLHYADRIREAYKSVKEEFSKGEHTASGTQSRFREQLLPILAILKAAGKDYKGFAKNYTTIKTQKMAETIQVHEYETIWERILYTNAVMFPDDERKQTYTIAQLLQQQDLLYKINHTSTGVFYLPDNDFIAVVWPTAITGPLFKTGKYSHVTRPEILRAYIAQDPRVVDAELGPRRIEVLKELRLYAGLVRWRDISVIPAHHFRQSEKQTEPNQFFGKNFVESKDMLIQHVQDACDPDASADKM